MSTILNQLRYSNDLITDCLLSIDNFFKILNLYFLFTNILNIIATIFINMLPKIRIMIVLPNYSISCHIKYTPHPPGFLYPDSWVTGTRLTLKDSCLTSLGDHRIKYILL